MTYRTKDQVASEFIAEGRRRGITARGIVICIATGLVESELTVYANSKVPESLTLPHDAVGSDGASVGPLQQQVVRGANGWWWGDTAECMDPTKSAGLFYDRLAKKNYNAAATDVAAGAIAQSIQGSAFPDRYATRMGQAQAIYDRLSTGVAPMPQKTIAVPRPDFNEVDQIAMDLVGGSYQHASTRSRQPINFFLHTQQGGGGDTAATDLAAFLRSTSGSSAVSYHYCVRQASDGGVTAVDVVDTDYYSWAVLNANAFSINLCFAGSYAEWTREQWMQQSKAIDVAAYLAVQDAYKYGFSIEVIPPPYAGGARAGISDHRYVTKVLGYGTHTDVGDNFPWDYFTGRVNYYTSNAPVVTQPADTTPVPAPIWPKGASDRELLEYVAAQQGPGDPTWASKGMTERDKLWALAAKVDAIAAKVGI